MHYTICRELYNHLLALFIDCMFAKPFCLAHPCANKKQNLHSSVPHRYISVSFVMFALFALLRKFMYRLDFAVNNQHVPGMHQKIRAREINRFVTSVDFQNVYKHLA